MSDKLKARSSGFKCFKNHKSSIFRIVMEPMRAKIMTLVRFASIKAHEFGL